MKLIGCWGVKLSNTVVIKPPFSKENYYNPHKYGILLLNLSNRVWVSNYLHAQRHAYPHNHWRQARRVNIPCHLLQMWKKKLRDVTYLGIQLVFWSVQAAITKITQTRWLKSQRFISQFWRLGSQNHGAGGFRAWGETAS